MLSCKQTTIYEAYVKCMYDNIVIDVFEEAKVDQVQQTFDPRTDRYKYSVSQKYGYTQLDF